MLSSSANARRAELFPRRDGAGSALSALATASRSSGRSRTDLTVLTTSITATASGGNGGSGISMVNFGTPLWTRTIRSCSPKPTTRASRSPAATSFSGRKDVGGIFPTSLPLRYTLGKSYPKTMDSGMSRALSNLPCGTDAQSPTPIVDRPLASILSTVTSTPHLLVPGLRTKVHPSKAPSRLVAHVLPGDREILDPCTSSNSGAGPSDDPAERIAFIGG
mmetsp:Transcript_96667/g.258445  ORF Transcript_96667/g.258445 Transcript_96667/m.258445 type:complete len:220 (+) Transcript_96667:1148-1807(+)